MIQGLQMTLTGEELRRLLDTRAGEYRAAAAHWEREGNRTPDQATEQAPLLPEHICKNEAERQEWRADVLTFVREHLDPSEIYQLSMFDLETVDLLPPKPGWIEQEESEALMDVGFAHGPFARRICSSPEIIEVTNPESLG